MNTYHVSILYKVIREENNFVNLSELDDKTIQKFKGYINEFWDYYDKDPEDFTPFLISNAHFIGQKNKKKCKINSRNFTYDSLTFSSSVFILEEVKDEI